MELEASVKGNNEAVFRPCSSVADGKIKFQLFAERVAMMFTDLDPVSSVGVSMFRQPEKSVNPRGKVLATQSVAPVPVAPTHLAPQVAESSKAASKHPASGPSLILPGRKPKASRPGDGWYVAHNAALPGAYYGV